MVSSRVVFYNFYLYFVSESASGFYLQFCVIFCFYIMFRDKNFKTVD
jgi:hypothetical protein